MARYSPSRKVVPGSTKAGTDKDVDLHYFTGTVNITGGLIINGDTVAADSISVTIGAPNTGIQYNNAGSFAATSDFAYKYGSVHINYTPTEPTDLSASTWGLVISSSDDRAAGLAFKNVGATYSSQSAIFASVDLGNPRINAMNYVCFDTFEGGDGRGEHNFYLGGYEGLEPVLSIREETTNGVRIRGALYLDDDAGPLYVGNGNELADQVIIDGSSVGRAIGHSTGWDIYSSLSNIGGTFLTGSVNITGTLNIVPDSAASGSSVILSGTSTRESGPPLVVIGAEPLHFGGPTQILRNTSSIDTQWEQPMSGALIVSADTGGGGIDEDGATMYVHSPNNVASIGFKNSSTLVGGKQSNYNYGSSTKSVFVGLQNDTLMMRNEMGPVWMLADAGAVLKVHGEGITLGDNTADNHQMSGSFSIKGPVTVSGSTISGQDSADLHQVTGTLDVKGPTILSGSNIFGQLSTDLHQVTGTLEVLGPVNIVNESSNNLWVSSAGYTQFLVETTNATRNPIIQLKNSATGEETELYINNADGNFAIRRDLSSPPAIQIARNNNLTLGNDETPTIMVSGTLGVSGSVFMETQETIPTVDARGAFLYSKDDSGTNEMFVMDGAGAETKISPHDSHGEWEYYSRNVNTGKVVRIKMEKMIRKLEELTGEKFIEDE